MTGLESPVELLLCGSWEKVTRFSSDRQLASSLVLGCVERVFRSVPTKESIGAKAFTAVLQGLRYCDRPAFLKAGFFACAKKSFGNACWTTDGKNRFDCAPAYFLCVKSLPSCCWGAVKNSVPAKTRLLAASLLFDRSIQRRGGDRAASKGRASVNVDWIICCGWRRVA